MKKRSMSEAEIGPNDARRNPMAARKTKERRIRKILIANRGEIALRIIRTAMEMSLKTVAVYEKPDS